MSSLLDRFNRCWIYDPSTDCWLWTRKSLQFYIDSEVGNIGAARFSYLLFNGPIPTGLEVCHHCDTPPCINPNHLFLGTHKDNMWDMANKGRSLKGRPRPPRKDMDMKTVAMIRYLCKRSDMKQSEIARHFGVSESAVSLIVNNKRRVPKIFSNNP